MFTLIMDKPTISGVLINLEKSVADFPFEVSENGIQISLMDLNKYMGIWVNFAPTWVKEFNFSGDGIERYVVSAENVAAAFRKVGYPIEMGSQMDGCIKIGSLTGRQTIIVKPVEDKHPEMSEHYRTKFNELFESPHIKVQALKQDLLEAVKTAAVAGDGIVFRLDGDVLVLSADSEEVLAEGVVPLHEAVSGNWEHSYNFGLVKTILSTMLGNGLIDLYLLKKFESLLFHLPLEAEGGSFCRINLNPVDEKREKEEISEEGD